MFAAKSIRHKLGFGLGLVLLMLGVLSISAFWGLTAFRDLVRDPAIDNRYAAAPAHQVTRSVARLRWAIPQKSFATTFDRPELLSRLQEAQDATDAYQAQLATLPTATELQRTLHWQTIGQIDEHLTEIDGWLTSGNADADIDALRDRIDRLEFAAAELPELPDTLRGRLLEARTEYRTALTAIAVSTGVVLLLLIGLIRFARKHVLLPIQLLHAGASRVAQGDFEQRVEVNSPDEMGELAEAFNLMIERFQQTAVNLDRQVQERSRQLVRSERLASVGLLAAGVAHEVNNPLAAVQWAGESLESRLAELLKDASDDEAAVAQQYVRMIQSEAERCQAITRRLLDFSRSHDTAKTRQDVTAIVAEVLSLITHMKKYRECRCSFTPAGPCEIEISGPEIKQVVLNLVANALDAAGPDGALDVTLLDHEVDSVELRLKDNGSGMDQETLDHLFEPFFTTKPTGEGTGLGLSISHRIVCDHGGTLEAFSDGPGCGSTFVVRLPRIQKPQTEADLKAADELARAIAVR